MNHLDAEPKSPHGVDLDALLDEVEVLMFRFARLMGSHQEGSDSETLTPPQYMVLRALDSCGAMRISDVATKLGVTNPAVSMLLNAMSDEGLIDRTPDPDDRRATHVSVSATGLERLAAAEVTRRRFMESVAARLTPDELRGLIRGLNELADAIAAERASEKA